MLRTMVDFLTTMKMAKKHRIVFMLHGMHLDQKDRTRRKRTLAEREEARAKVEVIGEA